MAPPTNTSNRVNDCVTTCRRPEKRVSVLVAVWLLGSILPLDVDAHAIPERRRLQPPLDPGPRLTAVKLGSGWSKAPSVRDGCK